MVNIFIIVWRPFRYFDILLLRYNVIFIGRLLNFEFLNFELNHAAKVRRFSHSRNPFDVSFSIPYVWYFVLNGVFYIL